MARTWGMRSSRSVPIAWCSVSANSRSASAFAAVANAASLASGDASRSGLPSSYSSSEIHCCVRVRSSSQPKMSSLPGDAGYRCSHPAGSICLLQVVAATATSRRTEARPWVGLGLEELKSTWRRSQAR